MCAYIDIENRNITEYEAFIGVLSGIAFCSKNKQGHKYSYLMGYFGQNIKLIGIDIGVFYNLCQQVFTRYGQLKYINFYYKALNSEDTQTVYLVLLDIITSFGEPDNLEKLYIDLISKRFGLEKDFLDKSSEIISIKNKGMYVKY